MIEPTTSWRMPEETCKHKRTWMAFGASEDLWENKLDDVRACLAHLARTISRFEPVTMLVRPEEKGIAARLCGDGVELVEAALNDIWIRDSGPVFVIGPGGKLGAVDINFNGWGKHQRPYKLDAKVAKYVADRTGAVHLQAGFVGEGGGIEVDGEGTAIITESCILNDNRNPGLGKIALEAELERTLGISKVIWLKGVEGEDITDAHVDFYARFVRPGTVVAGLESDPDCFDNKVTRRNIEDLKRSTDAKGRRLTIETIDSPRQIREVEDDDEFAAGYINYYLVNGAVIAPQFGDIEADEKCRETLSRLFPDREIVQLDIDPIAWGGGGMHCVTLGEPIQS